MDYLVWLSFASIMLLAVISPGPDFVIVIRNAVVHSQRSGVFTAIGIGLGVCAHLTYSILGLAALISQSVVLFNVIKYIGAAYLIYIGFKSMKSIGYEGYEVVGDRQKASDLSVEKSIWQGFLTNLLNPKATFFFLALLPQFMGPSTDVTQKMILGVTAVIIPTIWFIGVSVVLNRQAVRRSFMRYAKWLDRVCGGLLVLLGVRLALSKIA